jgi:hypothetical protein
MQSTVSAQSDFVPVSSPNLTGNAAFPVGSGDPTGTGLRIQASHKFDESEIEAPKRTECGRRAKQGGQRMKRIKRMKALVTDSFQ